MTGEIALLVSCTTVFHRLHGRLATALPIPPGGSSSSGKAAVQADIAVYAEANRPTTISPDQGFGRANLKVIPFFYGRSCANFSRALLKTGPVRSSPRIYSMKERTISGWLDADGTIHSR